MIPNIPVAKTLPPDVRDALVAASRVLPERDRPAAIEEAIGRAKRRYPHLFQTEKE